MQVLPGDGWRTDVVAVLRSAFAGKLPAHVERCDIKTPCDTGTVHNIHAAVRDHRSRVNSVAECCGILKSQFVGDNVAIGGIAGVPRVELKLSPVFTGRRTHRQSNHGEQRGTQHNVQSMSEGSQVAQQRRAK